jgi:hypothetical protein
MVGDSVSKGEVFLKDGVAVYTNVHQAPALTGVSMPAAGPYRGHPDGYLPCSRIIIRVMGKDGSTATATKEG